jgi:hypothetical protein
LTSLPDYFYYVDNPSDKKNVILYAWTRPTFTWGLECEVGTNAMSRAQAAEFYADTFASPDVIYKAQKTSSMIAFISVASVMIVLFFSCFRCCRGSKSDSTYICVNWFLVGFIGRAALLYYTIKCYEEINTAWV